MKFLQFFVFLVFFMYQTDCIKSDDGDGGNIVVINTSLVKIIETVVDMTVNFIIKEDTIHSIQTVIGKVEKLLINTLWESVVDELNELEVGFNDTNKAAIECIKEQGSNLAGTLWQYMYQLAGCNVEGSIIKTNIVLPMLVDISATNEDMKSLTKEMDVCVHAPDVQLCADFISGKMLEALQSLWTTLQEDIDTALKRVENYDNTIEVCKRNSEDDFKNEIAQVKSKISKCIEDKTSNSTFV
ncbi:hypothetical protein NQ315_003173 [Exocentrus adspersus]|uniref:Uncharacterized protein n=1 Tax=Exocentrus adspersus TaxID=1586481 RepID=A0AAV8W4W1_9CUCU|nr:hypothetical protein NQ315_003173 [Exocentrus adspersus]